jgi:hypothetical protein
VRAERLPRFAAEERADGWHVQYDHYNDDADYLHEPATLTEWDGARVRAQLLARSMRELLLMLSTSATDPATGQFDPHGLSSWVSRCPETALGPALVGAGPATLGSLARSWYQPEPALDVIARQPSVVSAAQARLTGKLTLA